jgi:cobalamin transport system substrate-binding protein
MGKPRFSVSAIIGVVLPSLFTLAAVAALTYYLLPPSSTNQADEMAQLQEFASPPPPPAQQIVAPTVASITPAGTDLVIGIGAADHLVAVSDLDNNRDGATGLPRVGDFNHIDWEKLAAVSPQVLITQFGDRMPADVPQRCRELHIHLIDVRLNVLQDVYSQALVVGKALGILGQAQQAVAALQQRLAEISKAASHTQPIRTAIVVAAGGNVGLIGPGTFHDQILSIAGGVNVAAEFKKPYIVVDREELTALAPDVVLDLEPVPPTTDQQLRQAAQFWQSMPDLPAVHSQRVFTITAPYCLRPGWQLADLAETFAQDLHGAATGATP